MDRHGLRPRDDEGGPSLRAQRGNLFPRHPVKVMDRHGLRPRDDGGDGVAIALLSLLPGEILPPSLFIWWDKAQHALAFAVLSVLGQFAYMMERRLVLFGLMVYRALIEIAQHATGWRYGEIIVTPA